MKKKPGRRRRRTVRDKLTDLILDLDGVVAVGKVSTHEGWERIYAARVGGARWFVTIVKDDKEYDCHGWQTMTECVKYGITIDWDDEYGPSIDANEAPREQGAS